jgi:AraC-like DNA-binding protein
MFVQDKNFGPTDHLQYNFQLNRYDYPAHIHQFAEIGYVISGALDVIVNGQRQTANEGDFILIFPMQVHEYSTQNRCDAFISAIGNSLTPELISENSNIIGKSAIFRCSDSVERYFCKTFIDGELNGIPMASAETQNQSETVSHFIDLRRPEMVCRIKSILYALIGEYLAGVTLVRDTVAHEAIAKVLLYMHEHYREDITLADVAAALGYSSNYLSHRIKKSCGMSFSVLLGSLRIERATRLLMSESKLRMIDIALECGFSNERSFHRTFKNITGLTPGEYIREDMRKV